MVFIVLFIVNCQQAWGQEQYEEQQQQQQEYHQQYYEQTADQSQQREGTSQKRYFASVPSIDYATVYSGIFDPNNIFIHVGQNFINFAAGTVVW